MSNNNGEVRKPAKSAKSENEILIRGGLTPEQVAAGRLGNAARTVTRDVQMMQLIITAGINVLKNEFDFTQEQVQAWSLATIKESREYLQNKDKKVTI